MAQEAHSPDNSRAWASDAGPIPPAAVQEGQLLLLDEVLLMTPKQVWRLIYDLNFLRAFYQKKEYRDFGIGGWQKAGNDIFQYELDMRKSHNPRNCH